MKKIVIFGATGTMGICAAEYALKKGLQVRAFVRNPARVPSHLKNKVEIVEGDILKPESVNKGLENVDGVVICLGTSNSMARKKELSTGTKYIADAMVANNVKAVSVCLSLYLFPAHKVPAAYSDLNDEHQRMHDALKDSPVNYISVYAPYFADEPSREVIITVNPKESPSWTITHEDLGKFLVDCLDEPKYYRSIIGIGNPPK